MLQIHPFRVAFVIAASAVLAGGCGSKTNASQAPPQPPSVSVVTVKPERVALTSEWIATLDGYVNAQVRPQVSGYLLKRDYHEGAVVHQGEVLFEIDPRPFDAVLAQVRANQAQAQAQLGKTERDLQRDRPLADQRAIAQSQLDDDVQADLAAQAAVKSAAAAERTAELNVGFTKVTSLITGVAAIATAQIGDLVTTSTLLTTVSQIDPIKAYFPISEEEYLRIAARVNEGRGASPWQGTGGLTLLLADGSVYPYKGRFLAADREIDTKTATIRMSAAFPNPNRLLRPGQSGQVRAETSVLNDALLVPQRAVTELQGLFQIHVVGPDNKVATRSVTPGPRVGNRWVISQGLTAGTRVVVEGAPAKDGTTVAPRPFTESSSAR
ncbi:MAG: efflux RND transporter periplasmic adaptor subunit [Vicinamibacterales bacterium]